MAEVTVVGEPVDNIMVDVLRVPPQVLQWNKEQGEKIYRYVCFDELFEAWGDDDELDRTVTNYLVNDGILIKLGQAVVPVEVIPPAPDEGNMLVIGEYGGAVGTRRITIDARTIKGRIIRLEIDSQIFPPRSFG